MKISRKIFHLRVVNYDPALLLLAFSLMTAVPSCGVCKHRHCNGTIRDSVVVNYKDSVVVRDSVAVRDSIVAIPLPIESALALLPQMMPSHLETSLAESDAYVDSLGLHHSLKNKEGHLDAHVPVSDHYHSETHINQRDSTAVQIHTEKVEVDKPLSWWQKLRIGAFWWLLALVLLAYRKPIIKIIKSITI